MGSKSDAKYAEETQKVLDELSISYETRVISAHRKPKETGEYAQTAEERGIEVMIGLAGAAAALNFDGDTCSKAGIALTNVGPTPVRALEAQDALVGSSVSKEDADKAGELAAEASQPVGDHRGSEEYKRAVVKALTSRAIMQAKERSGGN